MAHPKKKWGQHFLRNRNAVDRIVEAIEPADGELILEIGPGEGVLTQKLLELPNRVAAIEIDPDLAEKLRARHERLEVRLEDALDAPLPAEPYRAVGNLPYNVGTAILRRVIADSNCRRAVFMLQKEVAERLVAKPGDDEYGYLTLYARLHGVPRMLFSLGPKNFYPPPKVSSSVVSIDPVAADVASDRWSLLDLISTSFRMRRKKLVNNLTSWRERTRDDVLGAIEAAGLSPDVRAETMSLADFDRLHAALVPPSSRA